MEGSASYQTQYPDLANTLMANSVNTSWSVNNKSMSDQKTRSRYQGDKSSSTANKRARKEII